MNLKYIIIILIALCPFLFLLMELTSFPVKMEVNKIIVYLIIVGPLFLIVTLLNFFGSKTDDVSVPDTGISSDMSAERPGQDRGESTPEDQNSGRVQ